MGCPARGMGMVQKTVGLFDEQKTESRHVIEQLDDIYQFSDQLRDTALRYDESKDAPEASA